MRFYVLFASPPVIIVEFVIAVCVCVSSVSTQIVPYVSDIHIHKLYGYFLALFCCCFAFIMLFHFELARHTHTHTHLAYADVRQHYSELSEKTMALHAILATVSSDLRNKSVFILPEVISRDLAIDYSVSHTLAFENVPPFSFSYREYN